MTRAVVRTNPKHKREVSPYYSLALLAYVVSFLSGLISVASANEPNDAAQTDRALIENTIAPLLTEHCAYCHGGKQPKTGLSLQEPARLLPVNEHHKTWMKVLRQVRSGQMPPAEETSLKKSDRQQLKKSVINLLSRAGGSGLRDPGRVTIRRLNRNEYRNTIHDLFGIDFTLLDDFPTDDVGYDFDNIGDVLTLSPLLMEKFLKTADKIASSVIVTPESIREPSVLITALKFNGGVVAGSKGRVLHAEGRFDCEHEFSGEGTYLLRVRAWAEQAGGEPARMTFRLDDRVLRTVDVLAEPSEAQHYWAPARVAPGKHAFSVSYDNDYYRSDDPRSPEPRSQLVGRVPRHSSAPSTRPCENLPEPHLGALSMGPIMSAAELDDDR